MSANETATRSFRRDTRGSTFLEMTIVINLLLVFTFGVAEMGLWLWQWNSAEKATQVGVRLAATSTALPEGLRTWTCSGPDDLGKPCSVISSTPAYEFTCTGPEGQDPDADIILVACEGNGASFAADDLSHAAFTRIFTSMRAIFPNLRPENVAIDYTDARLGFVGRPSPVPMVTARIQNMTFQWVAMGALGGLPDFPLPPFPATMTGEDLNSGAP